MKRLKLGDFCSIVNGKSNTVDAVSNGEYCFFDRSKITKYSNKFLFDCEAIIVPGEGTDFTPRYFKGKFDLHQRCYKIEVKKNEIIAKYLYYNIYKNKNYFLTTSTGSTVPSLRIANFIDFPLNIHDFKTQQHIVNTIGSVDDLIENLTKQNKLLMFLGTRKINKLNNKYKLNLLSNIVMFEKGCEVGSLNYVENRKDSTIRYIRVKDLLSLSDTFIDNKIAKKIANFDDILVAFDGAPGRNNIGIKCAFSSGIYNLKCEEDNKGLVFFEVNSEMNKNIISRNSRGTTILHASKSIEQLIFANVDNSEKETLNIYFKLLLQNKEKIINLKHIKTNLLNKYF